MNNVIESYADGQPKLVCDTDDPENANYRQYYKDGALQFTYTMRNGALHGAALGWHQNGRKASEVDMVDGAANGELIHWFPSGLISHVTHLRQGRNHGSFVEWHANGMVKRTGNFDREARVGHWLYYGHDGRKLVEEIWEDNVCVERLPRIRAKELPEDWLELYQGAEGAVRADASISVTFQRSGKTAAWDPSCESVLDLAERHGVDIPWCCKTGADGVCLSTLVSGSVEYTQEPSFQLAAGECLPCIAVPKNDLVIDA